MIFQKTKTKEFVAQNNDDNNEPKIDPQKINMNSKVIKASRLLSPSSGIKKINTEKMKISLKRMSNENYKNLIRKTLDKFKLIETIQFFHNRDNQEKENCISMESFENKNE